MNSGVKVFFKEKVCNRKVALLAGIAVLIKLSVMYGILRFVPEPITVLVALASLKWLVIPVIILIWRANVRKRSRTAHPEFCKDE